MKPFVLFVVLLAGCSFLHAEYLIPSKLDPAFAEQREAAFIPWSNPEEGTAYWKKLSPSHVPILNERKNGDFSRDIYTPNPGTGYWVLGGLSEKALFKTHQEKLKIEDTLISASVYKDERGDTYYWALWAPKTKAHLLYARMQELGITPARIEFSAIDKLKSFSTSLAPFTGLLSMAALFLALFSLVTTLGIGVTLWGLTRNKRSIG